MAVALANDVVICQQKQRCEENFEMLPKEVTATLHPTCEKVKIDENQSKSYQQLYEVEEETEEKETTKARKRNIKITQHEKMPKLSIRFDGVQHIPDFDDNSERKGFRCKLKNCGKQTTVFCEKCNVHLCFLPGKSNRGRNCFKKFHQLAEN